MKIKTVYHNKKNYNNGRFDVYHISKNVYVLDIWRLSFFFITGE